MWPFKSKMTGQPVLINCGVQSAEFRKERAETRVANLTAKLARLHKRSGSKAVSQEIANTRVAIQAWSDVLELAELEISQNERGLQL